MRLRDLREDNDKKQEDIAQILNVSQATYSRYESGALEIPVQALHILAEFYNTSIDYLLELTNDARPYRKITESC